VIIPARNEERRIGDCLRALQQFMPPEVSFELLVGDHSSSDATAGIAAAAGATVVTLAGGTVGELRNALVAKSKGDVLIFIDADVTVTAGWGSHIGQVMQDIVQSGPQITGSHCRVPHSTNPFIRCWFGVLRHTQANYLGTGHLIVSRSLFTRLEGFTPGLRTGEDYDFCIRAREMGAQLVVRPELEVIHHDYPLTVADFIRRERWHGSGDVQSLGRLLRSKVALASLMFIAAHLGFVACLLLMSGWAMVPLLAIAGLPLLMSISKFQGLAIGQRVLNVGICYLYLVGRSLALLKPARPAQSW
jgi:glycosyltransferase involved in cell wall biosynthesis